MSLIENMPHYYLPLSLIFSSSGAEIVKRFVLTTTTRVISKDMTAASTFCEQAGPLNGTRKKLMHIHAMSILTVA